MFGIISDTHHHGWTAFSHINSDGVNSRNRIILDETLRAAKVVEQSGGDTLIHAGDLFHVRGKIAPSVLNPTLDVYRYIINDMNMKVIMIPGNHDMEAKDSLKNTNAVEALSSVGVTVCSDIHTTSSLSVIPFRSSLDQLKLDLDTLSSAANAKTMNVVIHAPVDDVIIGIPNHGLTATYLGDLGFKRVFCGHYHHHKDFGNGVYSVGALTHQTWGDIHSKAGFLLVGDDTVDYRASHAPSFVDLDPTLSPDDIALVVDGNYVRVRMEVERDSQISEMREFLNDCGAHGVVIHPVRDTAVVARTGATVKSGVSVEASVSEFIKVKKYDHSVALNALCSEIISEAEAA